MQFEGRHESERAGKAIQHVGMSRGQRLVGLDSRALVAEPTLGPGHAGQHARVRERRVVSTREAPAVGRQGLRHTASELVGLGLLHRRAALTGRGGLRIPGVQWRHQTGMHDLAVGDEEEISRHGMPLPQPTHPLRRRRRDHGGPGAVAEAGSSRVCHTGRQGPRRLVGGQPEIGRLELSDRLLLPAHGLQPEGQQHERRHRDRERVQQHPG